MMAIAIELIKQLREVTGAGVQDCRKALEQADQDYGQALALLREQGNEKAAKRAERPAFQGVVELYSHGNGRVGVMVEVNCETDFTARSTNFRTFAHEIALQIAAAAPLFVCDKDIPEEVVVEEMQKAAARAREEGKPESLIPRITAGYLEKFKNQNVLMRQVYIRDEKTTVEQLLHQVVLSVGENIIVRRFARWELSVNEEQ